MNLQAWSKAQTQNRREFKSRLDKVTGWLVEGDWHGSYRSFTGATDESIDSITNTIDSKKELGVFTLEFTRMPGGAIRALETRVCDGEVRKEEFIVGIQPIEKTFFMVSLSDNDLAFGNISRGSKTISVTKLEDAEPGDESGVFIYQFTNLLA
jgi:hypothetical protein